LKWRAAQAMAGPRQQDEGMAMQGDRDIIRLLNTVLTNELTSVNQYFLHARMLQNWGLNRLGKIVYDESIEEMRHADKLIKRILFLEGLPNLQDLGKLAIGETAVETLAADLALEIRGRETLVAGVTQCEAAKDYVSREILVEILSDTEEHIDYLETQLVLVKAMGESNYLQSAAGELEGGGG
jgi:bacterioferritin